MLFIADKIFNKLLTKKNKRIILLISSITIRNIPKNCSCYWEYNIGRKILIKSDLFAYIRNIFVVYWLLGNTNC